MMAAASGMDRAAGWDGRTQQRALADARDDLQLPADRSEPVGEPGEPSGPFDVFLVEAGTVVGELDAQQVVRARDPDHHPLGSRMFERICEALADEEID